MGITYNDTEKALPLEQIHALFVSVGWSDGGETPDMIKIDYSIPWINTMDFFEYLLERGFQIECEKYYHWGQSV